MGPLSVGESTVVVPWTPGPLLLPAAERTPDGVDQLVDELFGSDIDEQPGWFDLVLFAGGTSLFAWSLLSGASTALIVVGAIAGLLGCILPFRAAWRAVRRHAVQRSQRAVLERGLPLVADHPATGRLIDAYRRLLAGAALPAAAAVGEEGVAAAHQALVEVATLLDGKTPAGPEEEEYIATRTRAVETLGAALADQQRRKDAEVARQAAAAAGAEQHLERTARQEATAELDVRLGPVSLDRLELLTRQLEAGGG